MVRDIRTVTGPSLCPEPDLERLHLASPTAVPGTAAIRAGVALLAAFAFALSYDALRQMAVAIHIRGPLTYAFPLVIDGFIAIGIGALLMLRTAPTRSRLYVWTLVGLATLTSIWANALHAVRLNQQSPPADNLSLDDLTVGILSAIAPLALAGAVHLYLVIQRHPTPTTHAAGAAPGKRSAPGGRQRKARPPHPPVHSDADVAIAQANVAPASNTSETGATSTPSATESGDVANGASAKRLALARTAPRGRGGRASRRHIENAIRSHGLRISREEAATLTKLVQAELDEAASQSEIEAATAA